MFPSSADEALRPIIAKAGSPQGWSLPSWRSPSISCLRSHARYAVFIRRPGKEDRRIC